MKTADISVSLIDACGTDLSVVNAARVSFNKESEFDYSYGMDGLTDMRLFENDVKLIGYLAKHKHFSPFNHAFASFRVKAPIFVARQLVKHKFLPWNEVSRRYVQDEPEFFFPKVYRKAAENVKQGSSDEPVLFVSDPLRSLTASALATYQYLLNTGVCAEQARMVLPQNTMTEWVWSGTLGAWADMCRLRLDPHTQFESRMVAEEVAAEMRYLFPVSFDALLKVV